MSCSGQASRMLCVGVRRLGAGAIAGARSNLRPYVSCSNTLTRASDVGASTLSAGLPRTPSASSVLSGVRWNSSAIGSERGPFPHTATESELKSYLEEPSALDELPEGFSPGQAQKVLDQRGKDGAYLRRLDVYRLFSAARPGYFRDAGCILACLKAYKRQNLHHYRDWQAKAAVEGIVRAGTPLSLDEFSASGEQGDVFCMKDVKSAHFYKAKLTAQLTACRAFSDPRLGLDVALSSSDADVLLAQVLETIDTFKSFEESKDSPSTLLEAMAVVKRVLHVLIFRASSPEKYMRRRAGRRYKRTVMRADPPLPSSIHTGCQICLACGGTAADADIGIVSEYQCPPLFGKVLPETVQLIKDAAAAESKADPTERLKSEDDKTSHVESSGEASDENSDAEPTKVV